MRERTTWNRTQIKKMAADKLAAENNDIYTMNADHPQPAWDKYVTGDPSDFAEDIHKPDSWDAEYSGDQVKRNEIGMPEFRPETWNHPEKTAAQKQAFLMKKADLSIEVAALMLGKQASETAIEDQAVSLMHLPDHDLIETHKRLAAEQGEEDDEDENDEDEGEQQKQAAEEDDEDEAEQQKQAKQSLKKAQAKKAKSKKAEDESEEEVQDEGEQQKQAASNRFAEDEQDEDEAEAQAQQKQADQQDGDGDDDDEPEQQKQAQEEQQDADGDEEQKKQATLKLANRIVKQLKAGEYQAAHEGMQRLLNAGQQQVGQQQLLAQMQTLLAQAMEGGQQQQQVPVAQQVQQQQAPVAQQVVEPVVQADPDIDQLLTQDQYPPVAEADVQMDQYPPLDDVGMSGDDEVLRTLFAQDQEQEQEQEQEGEQQKQAAQKVRTASTRTVGTRPTGGVAKIGGRASSGGASVDNLSSLWESAPDVRETFGLK